MLLANARPSSVALLAEGVDRNTVTGYILSVILIVALLAEGVDRNRLDAVQELDEAGRPPRGGRG